jgi:hypothetical protein
MYHYHYYANKNFTYYDYYMAVGTQIPPAAQRDTIAL